MTAEDPLFGEILAIIYQTPTAAESPQSNRLSSIIISRHGTSGFMNMTLSPRSRYYDAVENLAPLHKTSMVRQALAVALLRSFATMDRSINEILSSEALESASIYDWDETMAGTLASRMKLIEGKYPDEIGNAVISCGALTAKSINTSILDVVYVDSDTTIEKNNELVYLLGDQLEQLFDPLSEYSPEPTEQLYAAPAVYPTSRDEPHVQSICQELYTLQANFTADLMDFLQDFLIPLRVKVLGGDVFDLSICKLNMIFPPTIDEIVRINNIFFESLQQSFPFGSFEILKACGTSIPYFYKACMRHEAATKNFFQNLKANFNYFEDHCQTVSGGKYTMRKIESIIHCSLHLTKIKLVIERLFNTPTWSEQEFPLVKEFYDSAVGTIDAFGKQNTVSSSYDRRVFTPTGKVLVELTNGWPKELEYGWINRRVITIFDAVDLLSGESEKDNHHIVIIFTDHLVILQPNEPIPMKSASGLHVPSVSDVLMHSMVNEVPLQNIPELKVVSWAPIEDVYLSEYNNSRNINIFVTGRGFKTPADSAGKKVYQRLYQLIRPDHVASNLVSLTAKAKVMNKTQPFHLFKSVGPKLSLYTTVHELEGYALEDHKTPIAVFMNVNVTREVLTANNLSACFKVQFHDEIYIRVECFTIFGREYEFDRLVHCNDFASLINSETAYLFTLHLSTKNPSSVNNIIHANQSVSEFLIDYAKSPTKTQQKNIKPQKSAISLHRRNPIMPAKASLESMAEKMDTETQPAPRRKLSPIQIINRLSGNDHDKKETKTFKFLRVRDKSPTVPEISDMSTAVPEMSNSSANSTAPTTPTMENPHPEEYEFPPKKRASQEDAGNSPQVHFEAEPMSTRTRRSVSSYNGLWEGTVEDSFSSDALRRHSQVVVVSGDHSVNSESNWVDEDESMATSTFYGTEDSEDEREQRDVNEWFNNFDLEDSGSLDSVPPEIEPNESSFGEDDDDVSIRKVTSFFDVETFRSFDNTKNFDESTIASSRILGRMNSSLARIVDTEDAGNEIDGSGESVETLNISEDFGYLAGLVGDADSSSKSSGTDQVPGISYAPVVKAENSGLHEGLRDTSILFLGAYVRSRQDSVANLNIKEEEESDIEEGTTMVSGPMSKFSSFRNDLSRTSSFFPLNHQKSQNSLSRMSYGTLQLASLTVEFDRYIAKAIEKIRESREPEMKTSFYQRISDMKLVKRVAMSLYDQTRNSLPAHLVPESKKKHMDQEEQERKSKSVKGFLLLASLQNSMTGMERDVLLRGYLNLEWQRRNRLEKNSTT
ncbi:hypothetical protein TRICI_004389 [Trichomonascus ciferrii]|uniref:DH domain-containing protein n=1 Tax=Trichomonascus ciferrii TaxID=44093 RepID=A0A642V0H3_9ASCO|nr:hypothetical protein TRICI_004389 [Trichomonascus ciferrii]